MPTDTFQEAAERALRKQRARRKEYVRNKRILRLREWFRRIERWFGGPGTHA